MDNSCGGGSGRSGCGSRGDVGEGGAASSSSGVLHLLNPVCDMACDRAVALVAGTPFMVIPK